MFVDLTPEQHALRLKVRDYFQTLMTPELRSELRGKEGGELYRNTIRKMGADGWLAVGWPKAHGGQGYAATEQLIFFEEANIAERLVNGVAGLFLKSPAFTLEMRERLMWRRIAAFTSCTVSARPSGRRRKVSTWLS